MTKKVSESQKKAIKNYRERNRKKTTIDNYKRSARLFIRKHSNMEDLEELKRIISEREDELQK